MTTTASYGHTKNLGLVNFEETRTKVIDTLQANGFGVLTEIDVKATMKKKLDADFNQYRILGACNPKMAHKALTGEPLIGLLLPCNVVLMEEDDGSVNVSIIKPGEMFKVVDNPEVEPVAAEVDQMLLAVLEAL